MGEDEANIRARYDLQHAYSMDQSSSHSQRQPGAISFMPSNESFRSSADDAVERALFKITEARSIVDGRTPTEVGQLEKALLLYQSALSTMVQTLSQSKSTQGQQSNAALLSRTAKQAMTEAENLKRRLQMETAGKVANDKRPTSITTSNRATRMWTLASFWPLYQEEGKQNNGKITSSDQETYRNDNHHTVKPRARSDDDALAAKPSFSPSVSSYAPPSRENKLVMLKNDEASALVQVVLNEMWSNPPDRKQRHLTTWSDIAGQKIAKQTLQESLILPLLRPDLYVGMRAPPRGILLYGPPGTGKTLLAKAAAHEGRCNFFACTASTLASKWVGEGEKLIRTLFRVAQQNSPSIVFMDEMDAMLSRRKDDEHEASRRFKTEFMIQVDAVICPSDNDRFGNVLVLGCTNCPWDLDDAILRRFVRRIYVPLPDAEARREILKTMLLQNRHNISSDEVTILVDLTEGFSCADLKQIGGEAAFIPLRDVGGLEEIQRVKGKAIRPINFKDFDRAISSCGKSVSSATLTRYEVWEKDRY